MLIESGTGDKSQCDTYANECRQKVVDKSFSHELDALLDELESKLCLDRFPTEDDHLVRELIIGRIKRDNESYKSAVRILKEMQKDGKMETQNKEKSMELSRGSCRNINATISIVEKSPECEKQTCKANNSLSFPKARCSFEIPKILQRSPNSQNHVKFEPKVCVKEFSPFLLNPPPPNKKGSVIMLPLAEEDASSNIDLNNLVIAQSSEYLLLPLTLSKAGKTNMPVNKARTNTPVLGSNSRRPTMRE